nr:sensor domain-containing diguanylate cyclase [Marinicella sp. W31]MDC2876663.1 sensor domain-containing diguanylate cyclase [Marinicella sp. W31]
MGVFENNRTRKRLYVDSRISEIYGLSDRPEHIDIQRLLDLIHPDDLKRSQALELSLVPDGPPLSEEFRIYRENDAALRHVRHLARLVRNEDGEDIVVGINWDVTDEARLRQDLLTAKQLAEARNFELDRAKSDIEYAAMHDYLTSLPNRRYLEDELTRRISIATGTDTHVALVQIDIDDFKAINSSYGHEAGDMVLRHVARVLLGLSKHNDFVGRMGGDEFAMLWSQERGSSSLQQVAKRILLELAKPITVNDAHFRISACIGLSSLEVGAKASSATELLNESDLAMKAAKSKGRGQILHYTPEIRATASLDRTPSDRLMRAVDENAFVPFTSPNTMPVR